MAEISLEEYLPRITPFTEPFWNELRSEKFTTNQCKNCGKIMFPPRMICTSCWSEQLRWVDLKGDGQLYAFTRMWVVPKPFVKDVPYVVGLVDLVEGIRLLSRIRGRYEDLDIGMKVRIVYDHINEKITLYNFEAAE